MESTNVINLLDINQVSVIVRAGKSKIYQNIKKGNFPAGRLLWDSKRFWTESEVREWVTKAVEEADRNSGKGVAK